MEQNHLPQVLVVSRGLISHKSKYLFVRRRSEDSYSPNEWEFPGGKLDEGETLEENLSRECREEIGLKLIPIRTDIAVVTEVGITGKYKGLIAITILGLLFSHSTNVKLSEEHTEYKWLALTEAINLDLTPASKLLVERLIEDNYLKTLLSNSKARSLPNK